MCEVAVTNILDLRLPANLDILNVTSDALSTAPRDYEVTQAIAIAAHQLELHGILAPAATGLGETLALFEQHLPDDEYPVVIQQSIWDTLPVDPRRNRVRPREQSEQI